MRGADERKGVVIGILVIVLLALIVFFVWHGVSARDSHDDRAQPTVRR